MSLDLSAAVEAAARAVQAEDGGTWEYLPPLLHHRFRELVLPAVTAAAPLIEAAVRARILRAIEAETAAARETYTRTGIPAMAGRVVGLHRAASIVRGVGAEERS